MNEIYEQAFPPERPYKTRVLLACWQALGLSAFFYLAWFGIGSSNPIIMVLRAVLLVETFGYVYHRWFQHVSFWTRVAQTFRRNQRFHWIHHMIIYPIGSGYRKAMTYVKAEHGTIAWSWVMPGIGMAALFTLQNGVNWNSFTFVLTVGLYAKCVVSNVHSCFHVKNNVISNLRYFHFLEDIHELHHWDQRYNFTIVCPFMDMIFGSYLAPRKHRSELAIAKQDANLTVSDVMNWKYLLTEASPAEYAAFISAAKQHIASLAKLDLMIELFQERLEQFDDKLAQILLTRALQLKQLCGTS